MKKRSQKLSGIQAVAARKPEPTHRAEVSHLILIPSYNSGPKLAETVGEALLYAHPVCVVIDGSTDGSPKTLAPHPNLRILHRPTNGGKGAAVLHGLRAAAADNFTHALVMDADGQHPAAAIPEFLALSRENPQSMILGVPIFDASAPWIRVAGRRLSNILSRLHTAGAVADSLFGFRIYPIAPLLAIMDSTRHMRRFDFDAEAAIRLSWRGIPALNHPAPVRYFPRAQGGISHFHYLRDNLTLSAMHLRLLTTHLLTPTPARLSECPPAGSAPN